MPLLFAPFRIPTLLPLCAFVLAFLSTIYQPFPNHSDLRLYRPIRPQHISRITMSLSSKLSITDVNLKGEKVLIRVDFNVPYVQSPSKAGIRAYL